MIQNIEELAETACTDRRVHFSEMSDGELNPTELVATLINQGNSFVEGLRIAQEQIKGSCSIMLLTDDGIYAARDRLGRTPIILGQKAGSYAATFETCAVPNLDFELRHHNNHYI